MNHDYLDFEQEIASLENKIMDLELLINRHNPNNDTESEADEVENTGLKKDIQSMRSKLRKKLEDTYKKLSPWQKTQVARHKNRPHTLEYIKKMSPNFVQLAGDRKFAEDEAVIAGIGTFRNKSVAIIGIEKGHNTATRIKHNFGMAKPEGYRKAQRVMDMANKFNMPIIALIDTAGAFPGIEAEERGQSEAIASSIKKCLDVDVPLVSVIIGEGGSGGAIALASGDSVLMLEHSIYSVISPEGCASILWRDSNKSDLAAKSLRLTAQDLQHMEIIDQIIPEPVGGAHRDKETTINRVCDAIEQKVDELLGNSDLSNRKEKRWLKYIAMTRNVSAPANKLLSVSK